MVDPTSFLTAFPAFSSKTTEELSLSISQAYIETDGYIGLSEDKRDLAVSLYAAHLLKLEELQALRDAGKGAVKKVKSKNDEIEFAVANSASEFELSTTSYGKRLERLIETDYCGGFLG